MKINKLNYFTEYAKVGTKHLDEVVRNSHRLLERITEGGRNWAKINKSPDVLKFAENQFHLLEMIFEEMNEKKSEGKQKSESVKKKSSQSKTKKSHVPSAHSKSEISPVRQAAGNAKKNAPRLAFGSPVETVDPHLVMLTRYRSLHEKTVPKERIVALARTLVKQIEARVLRKASEYSSAIEAMKKHLFEILHKSKGTKVHVNISEKIVSAIDKAIATEHQMKSVQLLRRYAGMAARSTTIEKATRLYHAMFNAIEKEQVPQDDRYYERVIEVIKNLKNYIEEKNERKNLKLLPAELSGILGCGCKEEQEELNGLEDDSEETYSTHEDSETDTDVRPYEGKSGLKPVNSLDFMKKKFRLYYIEEPWVKVFGHIEPGKHTVVFSKEKLGKTTALVDFAGYLSRHHGKVLIIQKEEELSGTFQDKFEKTQVANPNLDVLEEMPTDDVLKDYQFVFLDSVTRLKMSPDQLLELQDRLAPVTLIAVLHATKDGRHRGANTFVQDASQIVEFPEFGAAMGRGRFKGCTGELVRFTEPRE